MMQCCLQHCLQCGDRMVCPQVVLICNVAGNKSQSVSMQHHVAQVIKCSVQFRVFATLHATCVCTLINRHSILQPLQNKFIAAELTLDAATAMLHAAVCCRDAILQCTTVLLTVNKKCV